MQSQQILENNQTKLSQLSLGPMYQKNTINPLAQLFNNITLILKPWQQEMNPNIRAQTQYGTCYLSYPIGDVQQMIIVKIKHLQVNQMAKKETHCKIVDQSYGINLCLHHKWVRVSNKNNLGQEQLIRSMIKSVNISSSYINNWTHKDSKLRLLSQQAEMTQGQHNIINRKKNDDIDKKQNNRSGIDLAAPQDPAQMFLIIGLLPQQLATFDNMKEQELQQTIQDVLRQKSRQIRLRTYTTYLIAAQIIKKFQNRIQKLAEQLSSKDKKEQIPTFLDEYFKYSSKNCRKIYFQRLQKKVDSFLEYKVIENAQILNIKQKTASLEIPVEKLQHFFIRREWTYFCLRSPQSPIADFQRHGELGLFTLHSLPLIKEISVARKSWKLYISFAQKSFTQKWVPIWLYQMTYYDLCIFPMLLARKTSTNYGLKMINMYGRCRRNDNEEKSLQHTYARVQNVLQRTDPSKNFPRQFITKGSMVSDRITKSHTNFKIYGNYLYQKLAFVYLGSTPQHFQNTPQSYALGS